MPKHETVEVTVDDATVAESDVWTIIHPVWWTVDIYHGPEEYERSLQHFSDGQRLIFALLWYMSEVNNGGHLQFYSNSTGVVWKDACQAFSAIGVKKGADIILESAGRIGGDPALDREMRYAQLAQHDPDFLDLDDRFYELSGGADIEQAMLDFIRANPAAFNFSGQVTRAVLPNFTRRSTE